MKLQNGGSYFESFKVAEYPDIYLVRCFNELTRFLLSLKKKKQTNETNILMMKLKNKLTAKVL